MMKSSRESSNYYRSIVDKSISESTILKVFENGNQHFAGKQYVLSHRKIATLDSFQDDINDTILKLSVPIRKICTPNGGTIVKSLAELKSKDGIVCCKTKSEPFRRLSYNSIQSHSPRRNRHNKNDQYTQPVWHNKQYQDVQPRFTDYGKGKYVSCKLNGMDVDPFTIQFKPYELRHKDMSLVHQNVHETLSRYLRSEDRSFFPHVKYKEKLFDQDGNPITRADQIFDCTEIFIASKKNENWIEPRNDYKPKRHFQVPTHSPRSEGLFLWKPTEQRPRTLPPIQKHSPDNSVRSFPDTSKKRNQVNGVPIRAAKHTKRTTKQADYDKDEGGVFKAKNQSRDTRGAKEVRDTNDTKVDLPIDQVPAQEVKDEKIKKEKQGKDNNGKPPRQADHSHSRTVQNGDRSQGNNNAQSKTGVQNGRNSTYKSNSKVAPDQSQAKPNAKTSNSKTEVKKEDPPPKENKSYNNHDSVRSSTPKDNKAAPPPQSTPSPMKDNTAEENKAATKIQANYRGHQARKEVTDLKKKKETEERKQREAASKAKQDKEENEAATKIQATFRGHQARKEVNNKKQAAK